MWDLEKVVKVTSPGQISPAVRYLFLSNSILLGILIYSPSFCFVVARVSFLSELSFILLDY